jgi:hypothetical protein
MLLQAGDGHRYFIGQPPLLGSRQFAKANQISHPIARRPVPPRA